MRRTICNLSRELGVSRPRIYRAIERLGIEKRAGGEYEIFEWELLKNELSSASESNKHKNTDAEKISKAEKDSAKPADTKNKQRTNICSIDISTLKERLHSAKQEYDYNKTLITMFQEEAKTYYEVESRTTMTTHNGSLAAIPAITNLEKYVKLNIALSRLISDIEGDLDLDSDEEGADNPFG